jgi:hypothetical protein
VSFSSDEALAPNQRTQYSRRSSLHVLPKEFTRVSLKKMKSQSMNDYGAVQNTSQHNVEDGSGFSEHTQYLATHNKPEAATAQQNYQKIFRALFPVLIFAIIMIGLTYAISHDFGNLYPGRGSSSDSSEKLSHKAETLPQITEANREPEGGMFGNADCAVHQMCKTAGLIGQCCPTRDGVFLSCC